jgi:hypothetical protein
LPARFAASDPLHDFLAFAVREPTEEDGDQVDQHSDAEAAERQQL